MISLESAISLSKPYYSPPPPPLGWQLIFYPKNLLDIFTQILFNQKLFLFQKFFGPNISSAKNSFKPKIFQFFNQNSFDP